MSTDDGLRPLFRRHLPQFHWTTIETGLTTMGVADSNYLHEGGIEGWVEFKATRKWTPRIRPQQMSWLDRRSRLGGRAWIAVRRRHSGGPRLGDPADELWMVPAALVRELAGEGLRGLPRPWGGGAWRGGPSRWDWSAVAGLLLSAPARPLAGTVEPPAGVGGVLARSGTAQARRSRLRALGAALRRS